MNQKQGGQSAVWIQARISPNQGWNITCLGPDLLKLQDDLAWELAGGGIGWITHTQTISFGHTLYNWTPYPVIPLTFILEISSTAAAGWAFYADPAGQMPLADSIRVDNVLEFWVFGQPPSDIPDGPYDLVVTARTEDALPASQQVADLLWVGEWVAPPSSHYRVFLPVVRK